CPFHPRCGYAFDRCRTDPPPPLLDLDTGIRAAACWLQDGRVDVPAELARPAPAAAPAPQATAPVPVPPAPATAAAAAPAPVPQAPTAPMGGRS
ncbi:MAG TPA: hypothetical protein VK280_04970, partial [Streptosporangiaceae bacterium]|nr:hypothetical protein [Streptosporangiaceae bacterium]